MYLLFPPYPFEAALKESTNFINFNTVCCWGIHRQLSENFNFVHINLRKYTTVACYEFYTVVVSSGMLRCVDGLVVLSFSIERIAFTFERSSCQWVSHGSIYGSGVKVPRALHLDNRWLWVMCLTPLPGMEPRSLDRPPISKVAIPTLLSHIHAILL